MVCCAGSRVTVPQSSWKGVATDVSFGWRSSSHSSSQSGPKLSSGSRGCVPVGYLCLSSSVCLFYSLDAPCNSQASYLQSDSFNCFLSLLLCIFAVLESSGLVCHFSLPLTSGYPREILFPLNVLIQHMLSTAAHQTIQCSQVSYLTFKITQLYEADTTLVKESHALVMWSYIALVGM
jgi:hypothetical protein